MTKNWVRWLFGAVFLSALGLFVLQVVQIQIAIHHGESPLRAFQVSQQRFSHLILNPWFFTAYLLILAVLLVSSVRTIARKEHQTNDLWVAAALVTSIAVL